MDVVWLRDLVISIWGIAGILMSIMFAILAILIFNRVKKILDSVKSVTKTMKEVSFSAENEVARPLIQVAVLTQTFFQGVYTVARFITRKRRKNKEVKR